MSYKPIEFKNGQEPPINDVFLNNLQDAVVGLENNVKGVAIPLMSDAWTLDGNIYKQTVAVDGLKADSNPLIVPSPANVEATEEELNAWDCLLDETIVEDGSITFVASKIPSISFTVIAKGVMAGEGQAIADVTNLVAKVNELESEVDGLNSNMPQFTDKTLSANMTVSDGVLYRSSSIELVANKNNLKNIQVSVSSENAGVCGATVYKYDNTNKVKVLVWSTISQTANVTICISYV